MFIFDREVTGFGVRVQSNGRKIFLVQYCLLGVRRRMPLGAFGVLTVAQARKDAKAALGDVARYIDPLTERRAALAAQRRAANAGKAQAAVDEFTFRRLIDAWADAREGDRRPGYLATAGATMKLHLKDSLARPAASIATAEAVRALDRIRDRRRHRQSLPGLRPRGLRLGSAQANDGARPAGRRRAAGRRAVATACWPTRRLAAIWRAADELHMPYGAFVETCC